MCVWAGGLLDGVVLGVLGDGEMAVVLLCNRAAFFI